MKFVIPTLFGLEGLTADELRYIGFENVITENGRVFFDGDFEEMARANIRCRMGERVLLLLGQFAAESFEDLFQGVRAIDWDQWLDKKDAFPVKGWSLNSTLHSVPDCQKIIKKAIVERLSQRYKLSWFEESGSTVQIQFSIMKNEVMIMLDTSGAGLHKRGYRANAGAAPLRETLAAGMVDLAHVRQDSLVLDPMCGSGTLLVEAAMKARGISPGLMRRFACEKWSCFPEEVFQKERQEARSLIRKDIGFHARGFDIDKAAVELSRENAKKAHVEDLIEFRRQDVRRLIVPKNDCILLCNPPYGERLMDRKAAEEIYEVLGQRTPSAPGHSYYFITSHEEFETFYGRRADKRRKLYNGMLECQFYMYYKNHLGGDWNGKSNKSAGPGRMHA